MDTAVRFMLASIALLAIVNHAHANTGRDDAEVVLEAGEIDSSTVAVGTFVVVVYEREEPPQSLSGAWAKLDTTRGYIKAVDRQGLLLSLKGWPQRIALDRIQTLTPKISESRHYKDSSDTGHPFGENEKRELHGYQ